MISAVPAFPEMERLSPEANREVAGRIDMLDLSGCPLQSNIVRRQSVIGRHARPSQRLLLELEFLRLAPPCIRRLREGGRDALADTLERGWHALHEQLPRLIFKATLGSEEFQVLWTAEPLPRGYPPVGHGEALEAVVRINGLARRWLSGDYRADGLAFELALGRVAGGGTPLREYSRQGYWLARTDSLLRAQLETAPPCDSADNRPQAASLWETAKRQFGQQLQPQLAVTTERVDRLMSGITALEAQLEAALPGEYRAWRRLRDEHHKTLRLVLAQHPARREQVEKRCSRKGSAHAQDPGNWVHWPDFFHAVSLPRT